MSVRSWSVVHLICTLVINVFVPERALVADDVRILKGHQSLVSHLAFSPDSRVLASSSCDKTVKLWSVATGEVLRTLEGHQDFVWGVAFSPDGTCLASAGWDGKIRIWDVKDGRLVRELSTEKEKAMSVAFAPDRKVLASVVRMGGLQLWDTETWAPLESPMVIASMFPTVAFDAKGQCLCCSTNIFGNVIWMRDPEDDKFVSVKPLPVYGVDCHALSPDGKKLARVGGGIKVWDIDKKAVLHVLLGHEGKIHSLVFSSDGKRLVSGSDDKTVKIWDVDNGREEVTLTGHTDEVWAVAISPNGRYVASGGRDIAVRLWAVPPARETAE